MNQYDTRTAYGLAVHHGVNFWPNACPLCGDTTTCGRALVFEPGPHGEAVYLCDNCQTRFTRIFFAVAHVVKVNQ